MNQSHPCHLLRVELVRNVRVRRSDQLLAVDLVDVEHVAVVVVPLGRHVDLLGDRAVLLIEVEHDLRHVPARDREVEPDLTAEVHAHVVNDLHFLTLQGKSNLPN